jgi:predicted NBD/HSP70 family sugar kinase
MKEKGVIQPIRSREIRKVNERLLLRLLHNQGALSQTELASQTGLQPSTVFRIFADLLERGVIREVEPQRPGGGKKGRRPSFYSLNPGAGYAVGVDLATGSAAVLLVDFNGQAMEERVIEFGPRVGGAEAIELMLQGIQGVLDSAGVEEDDLIGVGVGAPGVVDIQKGEVIYYARFPGMEGIPIRETLKEALGVPVYLHNNASLVALSETRYGRAQGTGNLVAFLLRAGVGAAYIQGGSIFTSQGRTAFEAGHMFVDLLAEKDGEVPAHSVESFLSEEGLLSCSAEVDPEYNTMESVVRGLREGEEKLREQLAKRVAILVHVVRNIALLLNPESFLIITRFDELSSFIAEVLDDELHHLPGAERFTVGSVLGVEYDPIIACKGAAGIVFDAFFQVPR